MAGIPSRPYTEPPIAEGLELLETTLGEQGGTLPHGLLDRDNGLIRTFEFHPPIMRVRKKLGALKTRKDLARAPGKFVSHWLAVALRSLGPYDLDTMGQDQAALLLGRLVFSDVIYLLLYWQYQSRPDGFPLGEGGCHQCGHSFGNVMADLGTLSVATMGDGPWTAEHFPKAITGLRVGFELGGQKVTTVAVRTPLWADAMWPLQGDAWGNNEVRAAALVKAALCGVEGLDITTVPMAAVDELWPDDVRRIDSAMDLVTPTPDLRVKVKCPNCQAVNVDTIDWQSPDFFG